MDGIPPHCPKGSGQQKNLDSSAIQYKATSCFKGFGLYTATPHQEKKRKTFPPLPSLSLFCPDTPPSSYTQHNITRMTATDTFIYAYTKSEDRKPPLEKTKMPPLFDEPTTWENWHKHVNWPQSILLISVPLLGLYGAFTTELQQKTMIWSIIYYFITGLGITAGNCYFPLFSQFWGQSKTWY